MAPIDLLTNIDALFFVRGGFRRGRNLRGFVRRQRSIRCSTGLRGESCSQSSRAVTSSIVVWCRHASSADAGVDRVGRTSCLVPQRRADRLLQMRCNGPVVLRATDVHDCIHMTFAGRMFSMSLLVKPGCVSVGALSWPVTVGGLGVRSKKRGAIAGSLGPVPLRRQPPPGVAESQVVAGLATCAGHIPWPARLLRMTEQPYSCRSRIPACGRVLVSSPTVSSSHCGLPAHTFNDRYGAGRSRSRPTLVGL